MLKRRLAISDDYRQHMVVFYLPADVASRKGGGAVAAPETQAARQAAAGGPA